MNEIALSAWRVDESGFPSGGSIEEKLRAALPGHNFADAPLRDAD